MLLFLAYSRCCFSEFQNLSLLHNCYCYYHRRYYYYYYSKTLLQRTSGDRSKRTIIPEVRYIHTKLRMVNLQTVTKTDLEVFVQLHRLPENLQSTRFTTCI